MRRNVGKATGIALIAAVLSVAGELPALAQGGPPFKPLAALIVNDAGHPVPVLVTNAAPTPPELVRCTFEPGAVGSGVNPIVSSSGFGAISLVKCPDGVTVLDVHRVLYLPNALENNVLHWQIAFGLSADIKLDGSEVMAILTAGAPDKVLSQPVRMDLTSGGVAFVRQGSTGIPGVGANMAGQLVFEGVPAF